MADDHSMSSRSSSYSSRSNISQRSRSRSDSKKRRFKNKKPIKGKKGQQKHAIEFPSLEQALMDFEQFQDLYTSNDIPIEKLRTLYGVYERKWENKQKELFFEQHKDEQWIQDKYNPDFRKLFNEERSQQANIKYQEFLKQFNMGTYHSINLTITTQQLYEICEFNDSFYNEEQESPFWEFQLKENVDLNRSPFFASDPNQNSLFIKTVPLELSRVDIIKQLSLLNGYSGLTLSEPNKLQNSNRMGWVSFDSEEQCNQVLNTYSNGLQIKDQIIHFQKQQDKKKFIRIFKSVEQNKLLNDLQIQRDLIKQLDEEKNIIGNPLSEGPLKDRDDPTFNRQLDIQTLYLRKVHSYCYWSGAEFSDYRLLVSKVGILFLRLDQRKNCNLKWQDIIQSLATKRFEDYQPEQTVQDLVDNELVQIGIRTKLKDERAEEKKDVFPCNYCDKRFRGASFVIKHISGKHPRIYLQQQLELAPLQKELQMAQLYKQERLSKATIQRQIFQQRAIDEKEFQKQKLIIPLNFVPKVQQKVYKDLDSIAQEKTQPSIVTQMRESKVNYNDI